MMRNPMVSLIYGLHEGLEKGITYPIFFLFYMITFIIGEIVSLPPSILEETHEVALRIGKTLSFIVEVIGLVYVYMTVYSINPSVGLPTVLTLLIGFVLLLLYFLVSKISITEKS